MAKLKVISSRLLELSADINILIETRVKASQAASVRNKLNLGGKYVDNYRFHNNGRIWLQWNPYNVDIKVITGSSQMLHCEVYDAQGIFKFFITAIYALNKLDQRRKLWKDLNNLNQQGPWCLIGDFNNVLKSQDRIGGNIVTEAEYSDLQAFMDNNQLAEMESNGDYFTWSNKHLVNTIYSRIDRLISNPDWFHIWNAPTSGRPMFILWTKLKRLQEILYKLHRPLTLAKQNHLQARNQLIQAQNNLARDRMNRDMINEVKKCTENLINWSNIELDILKQRSKICWLKSGDENSSFFHASVKAKQDQRAMNRLEKDDGSVITSQVEIEKEVLDFYSQLMGNNDDDLYCIDLEAMRQRPQLTNTQREILVKPISDEEIFSSLQGIDTSSAPGVDGFNSKFFKHSWDIVKSDVIAAIHEFFEKGKLLKAFNCTCRLFLKAILPRV
ncbi:uncharacterized protein LOC131659577 [Vicia villosa]|uniref:uncharacterized protein LOC131659577 n=1 Tax=Vicia villosa TaxID=3911 RepID=UPI00273C5D97|nr:uncharacterized protein LOC131659577 [Vicia villosa]